MFENLDKIENVITGIFTQISLNKLSNFHDLNVLAENVFMYVLNDCFDYHLQNANILNNVPNQVGFDLIDTKNKIIFQVTSSDTIEKYSETIKKVKNVHGLEGFNLKFFILKASANKHPASSKIHNLSSPIIFDKDKDILDGNWLFAQFTSHFDRISLIEKHLELLFNGELSYKMIYSLLKYSETICDYPLPEHYLPRKFALKSDRSEAFDVLFSPEAKEYSLDKILEEVVKNNELRKFVIFSTAQNGKTTELYRLYNIISKDVEKGVQFIAASSYSQFHHDSFFNILPCRLEENQYILLDGMDELNDKDRNSLIDELRDFLKKYSKIKVVVTCRSNYNNGRMLSDFTQLEMLPLSYDEIVSYIKGSLGEHTTSFIKYIEQHQNISELLDVPFYLSSVVDYFGEKHQIPQTQEKILDYIFAKSLKVKEKEGDTINDLAYGAEGLFTVIALTMQFSEKQVLSGKELYKYLKFSKEKISDLTLYTIFKKDSFKDVYSFIHNGFKEHFVAKFLKNLSYQEILKIVCYANGEIPIIKKNWYNVLVLAISYMNESVKKDQMIDWLLKNDVKVLQNIDSTSISMVVKQSVLKGILGEYSKEQIYPDDFYKIAKFIACLCNTKNNAEFLLKEYRNVHQINPYLALLATCVSMMDFSSPSVGILLSDFKKVVFDKINELGNNDDQETYSLYVPFYSSYLNAEEDIDRLIILDVKSKDHHIIQTAFQLIANLNQADKYVEYIIAQERYLLNYSLESATHIVHRHDFYKCLGKVYGKNELKRLWEFLPVLFDEEKADHNQDHLLEPIQKMLCNSKAYADDEVFCQIVIDSWIQIAKDHDYISLRDTIVEIYKAFRNFCIENVLKPDFISLINEIRGVEDTQQEIRLLQILKIKLSLLGAETDLKECIDVLKPDSINDFGIATWLTNNYDDAWNLLHYDLVHKKFPKRRFYHPNEMKLREEKSMALLLDYAQFKETVLYIVNQYAPKARKELYAKVKECEENKWDSYVGSFMSLFYNYKTQEYDLQKIKNKIEDQSLYELFVLDQLANHRIKQLTGKQKNCLKVILEHVLPKIKDNRTGQRYLSLALDYEITLDKDVQEICLKYASVRDSRWEHAYSHKPFIDYAVQELGKERAEHRIISLIKNPKGLDVCDYLELAKYAINAHLSEVYSCIFEFIKHDDEGYSGNIINLYLKSEPDGMEQIMAIFQDIPDKHKAYVLKMLMCHLKDDMQWVKDTLAHFKDTLLKYDKKTYLECQALLGNQEALEEILKCMTEDKYYFGNVFTAIRFCNYTIDSLPVFDKLLDLSFTMDSSFWTSSIIDGIKGMVGTSSVNLEKVIKVLSSKITDERTWLNKTIDSIKYSYYEAVDSHMTIEMAAKKVCEMKKCSNSLYI